MATFVECSVHARDVPFGELFESVPGVSVELERIVPTGDALCPYVWIRGAERSAVEAALDASVAGTGLTLVDDLGARGLLYRVDWDPERDGLITAIAASNVTLLSAVGKRDRWTVRIRVDDHDHLAAFRRRCHEAGVRPAITRLQPLEFAGRDEEITAPQLEALELAFQRGYFDDPRRATLDDLAAELGITRQSLAGRLRRGHRNLLAGLFGSSGRVVGRTASFVQD